MDKIKKSELDELRERAIFWEGQAKKSARSSDYYQNQLAKAHEILGRVIHQLSERWDSVNLTKYFPTDNLANKRTINNPGGERCQMK